MKQQRDNQTKTKENKAKQNIPDQSATHSTKGKKKKKKQKNKTKKETEKVKRLQHLVFPRGPPPQY